MPPKLTKIKFPGEPEIEVDISDLNLTEEGLNKALCEQPGKFCYLATLLAKARAAREEAEHTLEIIRAEEDVEIRRNLEEGKKKPPEEAIKKMVEISEGVKMALSRLDDFRTAELMLTAIVQAYGQRKDCAVALAANLRQQFNNIDVDG